MKNGCLSSGLFVNRMMIVIIVNCLLSSLMKGIYSTRSSTVFFFGSVRTFRFKGFIKYFFFVCVVLFCFYLYVLDLKIVFLLFLVLKFGK